MLVVCRLLTSVMVSNHRCIMLDYIKCTYPLVSRLRIPCLSPLNLYLELYYHVNMLGSYRLWKRCLRHDSAIPTWS